MQLKRAFPLLLLMTVLLAGCFRQAADTFDTIDSEQALPQQAAATDDNVIVIDPNTTPTSPVPQIDTNSSGADETSTPEIRIIEATRTPAPSTTPFPTPTTASQESNLPTATQPTFDTPEAPTQLEFPTATPTIQDGESTPANNNVPGLQPTPTAIGADGGACEYVVASGDNLFRIALNNNVVLADLLAANNLAENSIIQPGQVLLLPDCEEEANVPTSSEDTGETRQADPITEVNTPLAPAASDTTIHVVSSGETLGSIARLYGVTIEAITEANNLTNPDSLAIDQELIIPNQ